jgi:hypothetical protein
MRALTGLPVLGLLLLLAGAPALGADCMAPACVGHLYFVHVPRSQFREPAIFQNGGLPGVNDVVALADAASLLPPSSFEAPWDTDLQKDLAAAVPRGRSLSGWGVTLRAGARVKILSYQQFPQLGEQNDELFALVLVLSDH